MARRARSLFFVVPIAVFAVAVGAGRAAATPPTSHHSTFRFSGKIDCRSFADRFVDRYWIDGKTYFGRSGKAIRTIDHVRHTSSDRNSKTGLVLHQHDRYKIVTDLRTGELRVSGGLFRINRPGRGMVIHDVGRVVMDKNQNLIFMDRVLLGHRIAPSVPPARH